jgi:hypothetical protein
MRLVSRCSLLLLLCGFAVGQATVIGGYASNWGSSYGYVGPYVPLITTPEVSLSTSSPWSAGASSSAFGLVAGAVNSTLSSEFVGETPSPVYSQPVWYGQTEAELAAPPFYGGPIGPPGEGASVRLHFHATFQPRKCSGADGGARNYETSRSDLHQSGCRAPEPEQRNSQV